MKKIKIFKNSLLLLTISKVNLKKNCIVIDENNTWYKR